MYRVELPERNVLAEAAKCIWVTILGRKIHNSQGHFQSGKKEKIVNFDFCGKLDDIMPLS